MSCYVIDSQAAPWLQRRVCIHIGYTSAAVHSAGTKLRSPGNKEPQENASITLACKPHGGTLSCLMISVVALPTVGAAALARWAGARSGVEGK